jgi:hypothetical protein
VSEVGVLFRHVNRDRLRVLVAEGNILLIPTVARRGIAPCRARTCCSARGARAGGSRRPNNCPTSGGTRSSRCRTCGSARGGSVGGSCCRASGSAGRSCSARARGRLPPCRQREHQEKG